MKIEEICTDYVCDDNLRHIDLYFEGTEQGQTAAVVDLDTGKVIFFNNEWRVNKKVQEAIAEILAETIVDKVGKAKEVLVDAGYLELFWHKNDIRFSELGVDGYDADGDLIPALTEDEVEIVARAIERNFDASVGVSWETIQNEISEVIDNRKKS